jgi:4a-hydroxytetrahydrobiopterin dehydratase
MAVAKASDLSKKHCVPCEGGVSRVAGEQARRLLADIPGWKVTPDGKRLRREWAVKDFMAGLEFFNRIGKVAEKEDHHPDLHLAGYRQVTVEISTHALDGLSENDFILAAKIDKLPVALKK